MPASLAAYDALTKAPLFSDLSEVELRQIAELFMERQFPDGKIILQEGQGGDAFFVIKSGTASVTVENEEHGTLTTGDYFGEIALFDEGARTASICAIGELSCYTLTNSDFRTLVEQNGVIGWKLLQRLTRIIRDFRR